VILFFFFFFSKQHKKGKHMNPKAADYEREKARKWEKKAGRETEASVSIRGTPITPRRGIRQPWWMN
jgi:hypothetical protein